MPDLIESAEVARSRQQHGSLLRVLGVGFGLAVTIGGTIGMGILRTPGEIAKQLPTPTLFIGIWIVGGVYALLGAISVAELGAMIPRSGGFYVFAHRALAMPRRSVGQLPPESHEPDQGCRFRAICCSSVSLSSGRGGYIDVEPGNATRIRFTCS